MKSIELNLATRDAHEPAGCHVRFIAETLGDPLASFPTLLREGRPYNLWLAERVLDPTLDRWSRGGGDRRAIAEAVRGDIEGAAAQGHLAFQHVLPLAERTGETAVLAAMGVAANLIRSLAIIGEYILDESRSFPSRIFKVSRLWCGLIDYLPGDPYFPGRINAPETPGRLHPHRRDPGHLHHALWCTAGEVDTRCAEAIGSLRRVIRRHGLTPDDLRHLHAHSWAPRRDPAA